MHLCELTYMRTRVSVHKFRDLTLLMLRAFSLTVLWLGYRGHLDLTAARWELLGRTMC